MTVQQRASIADNGTIDTEGASKVATKNTRAQWAENLLPARRALQTVKGRVTHD